MSRDENYLTPPSISMEMRNIYHVLCIPITIRRNLRGILQSSSVCALHQGGDGFKEDQALVLTTFHHSEYNHLRETGVIKLGDIDKLIAHGHPTVLQQIHLHMLAAEAINMTMTPYL